ncbi:MAG: NAD(P)-dependent oxidoreductase [Dehalococcoidales bacterium]|nr:NAD(P)-dependent oxidoreductase [Dehalococcoidales bacterium]
MTCLVTGGTGFIGSYIIKELLKDGEQIVAYDSFPGTEIHDRIFSKEEKEKVKVTIGDVTDLAQLIRTVKENKVNKLVHMAYMLTNDTAANPPRGIRVNIEGTNNVFETARILGLEKVVWASSVSVYGSADKYKEKLVPNDAPQYGANLYGACKVFNERMAEHYYSAFGVNSIAIRFAWIYGPGQRGTGGAANITRELMENPAFGKPGRVPYGEGVVNWLYVEDAARATALACKVSRTESRAFNTSGDIRSMKEAAQYVATLVPGAALTLLPGKPVQPSSFDVSKIEKELGFRPQWTMERGIKHTMNTLRQWRGMPPM